MPHELRWLGALVLLALGHVFLLAHVRTREAGVLWNVGPRDGTPPPQSILSGRLARAQANLLETLPLFAIALLACAAAGRLDARTAWAAPAFFWARAAYLPLYAAGVPVVRTLAWGVSLVALLVVVWVLLG